MGNTFAAARRAWEMDIGTGIRAKVEPMDVVLQVLLPTVPWARMVDSSGQSRRR